MFARQDPRARSSVDFNNIVAKIVGGGFGDASAAWLNVSSRTALFDPKKPQAHIHPEAGVSRRAVSAFRQEPLEANGFQTILVQA